MTDAFVCDAIRTPIGRFGGALSAVRADDLAAIPLRALLAANPGLDPAVIDEVILGCANQAGEDNRNVGRMASLLAGLPDSVPGTTVNRLCASGAEAVGSAARAIIAGELGLVVAGGVESMTRAPFVMGKASSAYARQQFLEDTTMGWRFINPEMQRLYGTDSMPGTAENVANAFAVSRQSQDAYAFASQQRTARAQRDGFLAAEITPVTIQGKKGSIVVDVDEHPRAETTLEALAALRAVVRPDGTVTAGNASGINDGAAAILVASHEAAAKHGLKPRARILGMASAGVAPRLMGIGPVPATRKLLARLGLTMDDFDVIEINEAFASQVIASLQELGIDALTDARVNAHGGAIALGHPLGMSGTRLVMTAVHALEVTGGRRALVTMCIGVGQGVALALERV
jgi:3-oxoadipyl-CoA thiolase